MMRSLRIAWIGCLSLAGLGLAFARGGGEPVIGLYPVELVDPAPVDPFEIDPLLAPAPLDCGDCRERTIGLAGGDVVTIRSPEGEKAADQTSPSWPRSTASCFPARSHTRAVLSSDAVTIRSPDGEKRAELTCCSWPRISASTRPSRSHNRAVKS